MDFVDLGIRFRINRRYVTVERISGPNIKTCVRGSSGSYSA